MRERESRLTFRPQALSPWRLCSLRAASGYFATRVRSHVFSLSLTWLIPVSAFAHLPFSLLLARTHAHARAHKSVSFSPPRARSHLYSRDATSSASAHLQQHRSEVNLINPRFLFVISFRSQKKQKKRARLECVLLLAARVYKCVVCARAWPLGNRIRARACVIGANLRVF